MLKKVNYSITLEMLTVAIGVPTLSKNIFKWYKLFQQDREYFKDDIRPGCPNKSTTDKNVKTMA